MSDSSADRARAVIVASTLAMVLLLFIAGPAAAHTSFEGSDPVDGSVIRVTVGEIGLFFTEPARPVGEGFVALVAGRIRTPDSVVRSAGGSTWTLSFDPPLERGEVGLRWTVQAPDAHPISGAISFRIDAESSPGPPTTSPADTLGTDRLPVGTGSADTVDPSGGDPSSTAAASDPDAASTSTGSTPTERGIALDDFLASTRPFPVLAAEISAIGRFLSYGSALVIIGGQVFAVGAVTRRRDLMVVLQLIRTAALLLMVGVGLESVGYLAQVAGTWSSLFNREILDAELSTALLLALALRFGGGLMAGVAAFTWRAADLDVSHRADSALGSRPEAAVGATRAVVADRSHAEPGTLGNRISVVATNGGAARAPRSDAPLPGGLLTRLIRSAASTVLAVAGVFVLVSFLFDGHTVTRSEPTVIAIVDLVHVLAAAVWSGGAVSMAAVLTARRARREPIQALSLAVRFSVPAAVGAVGAGLAGIVLTALIVGDWANLAFSPWGRLLMVKTVLVVGCAAAGAYNHFVLIPEMRVLGGEHQVSNRLRRSVTVEAVGMVLVVAVTAMLTGSGT